MNFLDANYGFGTWKHRQNDTGRDGVGILAQWEQNKFCVRKTNLWSQVGLEVVPSPEFHNHGDKNKFSIKDVRNICINYEDHEGKYPQAASASLDSGCQTISENQ